MFNINNFTIALVSIIFLLTAFVKNCVCTSCAIPLPGNHMIAEPQGLAGSYQNKQILKKRLLNTIIFPYLVQDLHGANRTKRKDR